MSGNNETPNTAVEAGFPSSAQVRSNEGANDDQKTRRDNRGRKENGRGRSGGRGRNGSWNDKGRGEKRSREDHGRAAYNRNRDGNQRWKKQRSDESGDVVVKQEVEGSGEEKEERKPKRKVAVLIGYCGTGYKGMQLNPPHKSIESDIFEALVKAGAISRANSNDPKKSSLVRCARTDKGVHAAGNVISLKLIIEDPDIVQKINDELPEQIRVWGIMRTLGSFSCYQQCDSRKYEYLVPSHCFLPPHPKTFLAKMIGEIAEKEGDLEGLQSRQKEVEGWWDEVDRKTEDMLKDEDQEIFKKAFYEANEPEDNVFLSQDGRLRSKSPENNIKTEPMELGGNPLNEKSRTGNDIKTEPMELMELGENPTSEKSRTEALRWKIRQIHRTEKKAYRISPERLARVKEAFACYQGTTNFHNYTVQKNFRDASSKRFIKSFEVLDPIIINNTEWLSLRVHGQSFMMHQIRKMVGMVMMVVRTGCPIGRIPETFGPTKVSIPKAPSLGLLLESPVFESYNKKAVENHSRDPIDFTVYAKEMNAFREKMIYSKLFEEEEKSNVYTGFVHFLDAHSSPLYTYLSSGGLKALEEALEEHKNSKKVFELAADSEDEDVESGAEGG